MPSSYNNQGDDGSLGYRADVETIADGGETYFEEQVLKKIAKVQI